MLYRNQISVLFLFILLLFYTASAQAMQDDDEGEDELDRLITELKSSCEPRLSGGRADTQGLDAVSSRPESPALDERDVPCRPTTPSHKKGLGALRAEIRQRRKTASLYPGKLEGGIPDIRLACLSELRLYGRVSLSKGEDGIPEAYESNVTLSAAYQERLGLWADQLKLLEAKAGRDLITLPDSRYISCALHVATREGLPIMVGLLLERGATKDWKNHLNWVPHHYIHRCADEDDAVKIAQQLVTSSDDLEPLSWLGETVITLAAQDKRTKLLEYYRSLS